MNDFLRGLRFAVLGVALAGGSAALLRGQANPVDMASLPSNMIFDVKNGDQEGKLMLKDSELAFESLTDARHSRNWKYADIREISKKRKELSVKPFKGSKYAFQFRNNEIRDRLYKMISDRILVARQGSKRP